jgi:hypothetical protein
MPIITFTTDFGTGSPYVAAMKGVVLSICPGVTLVDITHDVPAQDVRHASVVLDGVCERFPAGTIHVVVVDPGVGTDRAIVYAEIANQCYVGPDNGVLSRLAERTAPSEIIRLDCPRYWLPEISHTFHGRDIMAPVAAHLARGVEPGELGPAHEGLMAIEGFDVRIDARRIDGAVEEIDSFGNLITNITAEMLHGWPVDERVCTVCNIFETWGIWSTYGEQPSGTLVALIGSSGRLELAVVDDNAAERLGLHPGTPVTIAWE